MSRMNGTTTTARKRLMTGLGALAVVAMLGAGTSACSGDDDKPKKVGSTADDTSTKGSAKDKGTKKNTKKNKAADTKTGTKAFKVGDKIELGDWGLVVHKVTDPLKPTDEFMTPEEGNRWVLVDLEVLKNGGGSGEFSSLLSLEIKDSTNKVYDQTVIGTETPPDGTVAEGDSRRGEVAWEVPETATGLTLGFKPDIMSESTATVELG